MRHNGIAIPAGSVASFQDIYTTSNASSTSSEVSQDNSQSIALAIPNGLEHESEDAAMVMDETKIDVQRSQVNQRNATPVEAELNASDGASATGSGPTSRLLRRRQVQVSYLKKPVSEVCDVEDNEPGSQACRSVASKGERNIDEAGPTRRATPLNEVARTSMTKDEEVLELEDVFEVTKKPKTMPRATTNSKAGNRAGRGIDTSLPPLDNIDAIFADMATKALGLGLDDVLFSLGDRPINIATMCSGTESPLIALELLSKGLEQQGKPPIRVNHHFSAEIDVIKQGYIERNFQPRRLFRDVREFISPGVKTATTAYGAEEPIPGGLDMLIAGFVCRDLSRMNNHQKGLDDGGESGDTWQAIYSYIKHFRPSIVIIENVRNTNKFWNDFESKWNEIGYEYVWTVCDTKNYYIPQTRQRMYMIAIDRSQYGKGAKDALKRWSELMTTLQRRSSSPFDAFLTNDLSDQYEHTSLASDPNWALCKLRYDQIRSEQRLGIRRPITRWSDNGTVRPPDFANRQWYHSQSSRVYDCIDVAHLQGVQSGYDSMYKMAVWDVSQNVDRFKADLGIVSCITPGGSNFVSNRHTALTGSQLLLLQGMPANKLLFAKETQKDRQDLAGNAMTTTVIGASIVAALITGRRAFRKVTEHEYLPMSDSLRRNTKLVTIDPAQIERLQPTDPCELHLDELIREARLSSRLCNCEGTRRISKSAIQVCNDCGHTACVNCAGNPMHSYSAAITPNERELEPSDFEQKWRPLLPSRLRFSAFPDLQMLGMESSAPNGKEWKAFVDHIAQSEIQGLYFSITGLKRHERSWKASYESSKATLELVINSQINWNLFLRCPISEPGNSQLRATLARPFARGSVISSLLDPQWQIYIPHSKTYSVTISGSKDRASAWRSRLGLPDHKNETVPLQLQIDGGSDRAIQRIGGRYEHLPNCGTAKSSLYKATDANSTPVYLFLDQDPIGPCERDSFVFSLGCERVSYGDSRNSLAFLEPSWQPWDMMSETPVQIRVTVPGKWIAQPVTLEAASCSAEVSIPTATALSSASAVDCSQAIVLIDVKTAVALNTGQFEQFAWTLEQAKTLPQLSHWLNFQASCPHDECDCAPLVPRILWSVNEKGKVTAHEDRKAAAQYERILKTRCDIFHVRASPSSAGTRVQVGLNIASLIHRAENRLSTAQTSSWRLLTDHADPAPERFPKFRLRSNKSDAPYAGLLRLQYSLGHEQLQSLSWMKEQEYGQRLPLVEVEEAIHSELGWRIEAKAETSATICGGVLADLPSFGKTVTTIALINDELEGTTTDELLQRNYDLSGPSTLIDIAATLVVCPPHIAKQWHSEFRNCLGRTKADSYNIILVESFSDLKALCIDNLRDAKVVILSWSVLADEAYIAQLARFSAMPLPASTKGRAYDAWLEHCIEKMGSRVNAFQKLTADEFSERTQKLLDDRLAHPDFKATVPLKIAHGSAYQSVGTMPSTKAEKPPGKKGTLPRPSRASDLSVPLVQMFNFNRIVVDEYHYLYDSRNSDNHAACAAIKRVASPKRWVLSGTPALANFSDIGQIASFLGVKLGRNVYGDGVVTTALEKRLMNEQTDVEKFVSSTETMSWHWHRNRHAMAQNFLDQFVRQNEPALHDIACQEILHPIELSVAHRAVYLELSQHLISQRMQIKKLKNKSGSDRYDRLNASLSNSGTAEEALLKSALLFETNEGELGLSSLMDTRKRQRKEVEAEISTLLEELREKCLQRLCSPAEDYYLGFKHDVETENILGDEDVRQLVCKLIAMVEKNASTSIGKRTNSKATSAKDLTALKELASELRTSAHELTLRVRSQRFITSIAELLPALAAAEVSSRHKCSSPSCAMTANMNQLFLISYCGHAVCESCLQARPDSEACVYTGCEVPVQRNNLIKVSDLGSPEDVPKKSFGRKLDNIAALINSLPNNDQGIVFVSNNDLGRIMEDILDHHGVSYHSLSTRKASAAKLLEDFKTNADTRKQKKVLILNLASESAAGA